MEAGVGAKKSTEIEKEGDRPPAHSRTALLTKQNTKWNPTVAVAGVLLLLLLASVLIGGLLLEIRRLNAEIAGQKTEKPKCKEPTVELRTCLKRVANLTEVLVAQEETTAFEITRLEAEVARLKAELTTWTAVATQLDEEETRGKKKNQQLEKRSRMDGPAELLAATTKVPPNTTSNGTSAAVADCSFVCRVVKSLSQVGKPKYTYGSTFCLLFGLAGGILLALVLLLASFCGLKEVCFGTSSPGMCAPFGETKPLLHYRKPFLLIILGIVGFFCAVAGVRDLLNLCFD
ncbi:hypothetical protein M3Y99_00528600 [Aphelenchoides fujianensis]|nr:hypothetical protein M3Y99_00528600 [Aphelenchoides fujianensis]